MIIEKPELNRLTYAAHQHPDWTDWAELYHVCEYCGAGVGERCHVLDEPDTVYRDKYGKPYTHGVRKELVDRQRKAKRTL